MALALAILSALSWGVAAVAGGLLACRIGALPALGWVMVLSLIAALPLALASGPPGDLDGTTLIGVVIVTAGGLGGLGLIYAALRLGSVSVVAPVSATYGGVAALLAVVAGATIGAVATLALGVAVVGPCSSPPVPPSSGACSCSWGGVSARRSVPPGSCWRCA